jgi:hypothetical protein
MVARAADAIVSGAVLDMRLQPYEAHIPYLLQFKLDMNLYGMAHMALRVVEFRKAPPAAGQGSQSQQSAWEHQATAVLPMAPSSKRSSVTGSQVRCYGHLSAAKRAKRLQDAVKALNAHSLRRRDHACSPQQPGPLWTRKRGP